MKKVYIFLFLMFISHTMNIDIRDTGSYPHILVNVNGKTSYSTKVEISPDQLQLPLYVNVYSIEKDKKYFKPLLKRTIYENETISIISNRETIIDILFDMVKKKIDVEHYNYQEIREKIIKAFRSEITSYENNTKKGITKKLRQLDWVDIEHKINKLITQINHSPQITKILDFSEVVNYQNKYIEIYTLNKNVKKKTLNFLNKYENITKQLRVQIPPNSNIMVFVYNKTQNKLLFLNYLSTNLSRIKKENETKQLIQFEFDRLLMECTHNPAPQRNCYYFDVVEQYVSSKETLLNKVLASIPAHVFDNQPQEKLLDIRGIFFDTMVNTVQEHTPGNI